MAQLQKGSPQIQTAKRKSSPVVGEPADKESHAKQAGGPGKSPGSGSGSNSGGKAGVGAVQGGRAASPAVKKAKPSASPASTGSPATTTSGSPVVVRPSTPTPAGPTALGAPAAAPAGQGTEGRKISCEDIQLVQNLIERCLQLYMNQKEVISTLQYQAKIEPGFTSLVWQKLEEQNPDFFAAYYMRLRVKEQVQLFNQLLEQHSQLLQKHRMTPTPGVGQLPSHKMPPPPAPGVLTNMPPPVHGAPMGYPLHRPPGMGGPPMPSHVMAPHGGMRHGPSGAMPMGPPHGPYGHPPPPHGGRGRPPMMDMPAIGVPSSFPGPPRGHPPHSMGPPMMPHHENGCNGVASSSSGGDHSNGIDDVALRGDPGAGSGDLGGPNGAFPFNNTDLELGLPPQSMPMDHDNSPFGSASEPPASSHSMQLSGDVDVSLTQSSARENLGSLGHLPRNFSLSDLASEFHSVNQPDGCMLGGLPGSPPYMSSDPEAYLRSPDKDDDEKLLDPLTDLDFEHLK